jgi:hypothetical protein
MGWAIGVGLQPYSAPTQEEPGEFAGLLSLLLCLDRRDDRYDSGSDG